MIDRRPILVTLALLASPLLAAGRTPDDLLGEADRIKGRSSQYETALELCVQIIEHEDATRDQKVEAYDIMLYAHRRRRKRAAAVQTMEEMRKTFPGAPELQQKALFEQITEFWHWNKPDEGLDRVETLIALPPADDGALADAWAWKARFLHRQRKYGEAFAAGSKVVDIVPEDDERISDILGLVAESAWNQEKMPDCERVLRRLLEAEYRQHRSEWEVVNARRRLGETLERQERYADAHAQYVACEKGEQNVEVAHDWC
ncbi:MAG: hypothetical protein ACODAJ_01010, partial [Planctomycetota bacterium]